MSRSVSEENPITMGHEGSGVVHEVGPAVTTLAPGDRVSIEPGTPCRRCKQCKSAYYNLCRKMRFASDPPFHGLLARIVKIPEDFAYKLPDHLDLQEGALIEPCAVAVHANRLADVKAGQTVLVLGSGTVGLLTAAVAKAFGAMKVFIADINEKKLEVARNLVKCDDTFVPDLKATPEGNAARFKQQAGLEDGADVVMECTGAESSAQTAVYAARAGGIYVQVGMGKPMQSLPLLAMCDKELTCKASFRYGPGDYDLALELVSVGKVDVKPLVSNIFPFENAPEAWECTRKGEGIKNLIQGVKD